MRTRTLGVAWLVACAIGCGARTELFGVPPEDDASDAAQAQDAAVGKDGAIAIDATVSDAFVDHDASTTFDASTFDATTLDAGVDAAPITCAVTSPTLLANAGEHELDQIVVADSWIYFHDDHGISRVSKQGGAPVLLATTKGPSWPDFSAFALIGDDVVWWQISNGKMQTDVRHAPRSGGATTTIATLPDYFFYGAAASDTSVFAWNGAASLGTLDQIELTGSVTTISSAMPHYTSTVAADGVDLFALSDDGIYARAGAGWSLIASPLAGTYPNLMAFDDTTIYVASSTFDTSFVIASVPKTGGTMTALATVPNAYLGGIVVDGAHVYFADRIAARLLRMNKDGSELTTIAATSTSQIVGVAVDDLCVYWSTTTNTGTPPSGIYATPK